MSITTITFVSAIAASTGFCSTVSFQQPERVVGFFGSYRNQYSVSRDVLRRIAEQFQNWVKNQSNGYRICLIFVKLFERIYTPLSAGLLRPFPADKKVQQQRLSQLDRLYPPVTNAVDDPLNAVGLKAA
jgi:hypothetical protein